MPWTRVGESATVATHLAREMSTEEVFMRGGRGLLAGVVAGAEVVRVVTVVVIDCAWWQSWALEARDVPLGCGTNEAAIKPCEAPRAIRRAMSRAGPHSHGTRVVARGKGL